MTDQSFISKICFDITLKPQLLKELEVSFDGKKIKFLTYPGVFSYRKADSGTMLLARNLPDSKPGKILDMGCGCGLLSLLAFHRYPYAEIHAVDIDPRAVALSELNFEKCGNATAWGSNLFDQVIDRDYDLIISNIPAKPTKEVHTELIEEASLHLKPGGEVYIVAAGRLYKYLARVLENAFGNSEKVKASRAHTVVSAVREK